MPEALRRFQDGDMNLLFVNLLTRGFISAWLQALSIILYAVVARCFFQEGSEVDLFLGLSIEFLAYWAAASFFFGFCFSVLADFMEHRQ